VRRAAFRGSVIALALLAGAKLSDELLRLVWRSGRTAAIDLVLFHNEVHAWFAGRPVYAEFPKSAAYPPGTFPLLWPFVGWLPIQPARYLWAATAIVALAWLTWIIVRESRAADGWSKAFAALMLLSMNQTGVALGNGQLILHVLPVLLTGVLLVQRGQGSWREDLLAAACLIVALVKITITVPFLWLVLVAPNDTRWRFRPAVLVTIGYVGLTLIGASFQSGPLISQLRDWLAVAGTVSDRGADYGNINSWLHAQGADAWRLPASLAILLALGLWLHTHRQVEVWVRLGVIALVARFWTYHRLYDDVLVVIALVPLFRLASPLIPGGRAASEPDGRPTFAGIPVPIAAAVLLATTMAGMLLLARLGTSPPPWKLIFNGVHEVTWFAVLAFLASVPRQAETGDGRRETGGGKNGGGLTAI
jgi:hypothetical protein